MNSDQTFFTNEPNSTLLDRFKSTLHAVKYFDILVGYFRTSGFYNLYEHFENIRNYVDQIVTTKKANPQAGTSKLEAEIDCLVYELYGLTEEEITMVEESVGG